MRTSTALASSPCSHRPPELYSSLPRQNYTPWPTNSKLATRDSNDLRRRRLNIAPERQRVHTAGIALLSQVAQRFLRSNSIATDHDSAAGSQARVAGLRSLWHARVAPRPGL